MKINGLFKNTTLKLEFSQFLGSLETDLDCQLLTYYKYCSLLTLFELKPKLCACVISNGH